MVAKPVCFIKVYDMLIEFGVLMRTIFGLFEKVGVRGDIKSLGVMGWGLDAARRFFRYYVQQK